MSCRMGRWAHIVTVAASFTAVCTIGASGQERRQGEPGRFDFYVLALSWSPSYCEAARDRRPNRAPDRQCAGRPFAFVVHGLWPQYERGFPSYCQVPAPRLDRSIVGRMLDVMPSPGLIFLPVELVAFARAAADEAEGMAEDKNLALQRDFPVAPVIVWTDRVALGAIVDNFVSNALKYSTPGGTIRIRIDRDGEEGIIAITDSGSGIAEGTTFDVFDRGKILSSRPTAGEPSTGYGMAIVRDLAGLLGARVWFQNEPARGATFFVAIPLFDPSRHIAGPA